MPTNARRPDVDGRASKRRKKAAVVGKHDRDVTRVADAGSLHVAVAVIGVLRMRVNLPDYLKFIATGGTDAGGHRSRINAEVSGACARLWFEDCHGQRRIAVGPAEKVDDAFVTDPHFPIKCDRDGVETVLCQQDLRLARMDEGRRCGGAEKPSNLSPKAHAALRPCIRNFNSIAIRCAIAPSVLHPPV